MEPAEFGRKVKELRERAGLTQEELSDRAGLRLGTLNNWEQGRCFPEVAQLISLCRGLGVGPDALLDVGVLPGPEEYRQAVAERDRLEDDLRQAPPARRRWALAALDRAEKKVRFIQMQLKSGTGKTGHLAARAVPLLGTIRAGIPTYAEEAKEGTINLPYNMPADYALRVKGDSMTGLGIYEGDVALCRQPAGEPPANRIVVCLIDSLDATLKILLRNDGHWILRAANPIYPDVVVNPHNDIIQGVVTAILRDVDHDIEPVQLPEIDSIARQTGVPSQVIRSFLTAYSSMEPRSLDQSKRETSVTAAYPANPLEH